MLHEKRLIIKLMDNQMVHRRRRLFVIVPLFLAALFGSLTLIVQENQASVPIVSPVASSIEGTASPALEALKTLPIKGRAPTTDYSRDKFGNGWQSAGTCDMRNKILARDMQAVNYQPETCIVQSGTLQDPYTGKLISFARGTSTSSAVQIDHVVALSDAWQKGAQSLTAMQRQQLANDPLELLAVDGSSNMKKSNGDAATWLPSNKAFRCQYVARQIAVKQKYSLWVTAAEHGAIASILNTCPGQTLPQP